MSILFSSSQPGSRSELIPEEISLPTLMKIMLERAELGREWDRTVAAEEEDNGEDSEKDEIESV